MWPFNCAGTLIARSVNKSVGQWRTFHILGYQPCYENEARLTSTQNVCVTQYVSIHQPSRDTEIFRPTSVHLRHDTLRNLSVYLIEEILASM